MKKATVVVFLFLASYMASCASTANYPITLYYQPFKQYEKTGGPSVTVALLSDKRPVADKRAIGTKENGGPFIALIDEPAAAISKGFAVFLENRGWKVNKVNEAWDGNLQSINPNWGDIVVGGTLNDLTLNVKGNLIKTEYACSVKFTLSIADAKSRELLHKEKFEVSSSYVTVPFSRGKAEELINKELSDAVERGLADIGKYVITKQQAGSEK
jgi:hypothetical protein